MIGNANVPEAVFEELCKADPAQSVFVLPPDGTLQHWLCTADRVELMELSLDIYRRINVSAVQREVGRFQCSMCS